MYKMATQYVPRYADQRVPMRCPVEDCQHIWKSYAKTKRVTCPDCALKSQRDHMIRAWEENPDWEKLNYVKPKITRRLVKRIKPIEVEEDIPSIFSTLNIDGMRRRD